MQAVIDILSAWASAAVDQLGPGGAIVAAVLVLFVALMLVAAIAGMVSLRAMSEADTPEITPPRSGAAATRRMERRRRERQGHA